MALEGSYEKAGFLIKQGQLNKSWKNRLFVLRDDKLFYYASKKEAKPLGYLILRPESTLVRDASHIRVSCFSVLVAKSFTGKTEHRNRTYYLRALDDEEKTEWMNAIQMVLERASFGKTRADGRYSNLCAASGANQNSSSSTSTIDESEATGSEEQARSWAKSFTSKSVLLIAGHTSDEQSFVLAKFLVDAGAVVRALVPPPASPSDASSLLCFRGLEDKIKIYVNADDDSIIDAMDGVETVVLLAKCWMDRKGELDLMDMQELVLQVAKETPSVKEFLRIDYDDELEEHSNAFCNEILKNSGYQTTIVTTEDITMLAKTVADRNNQRETMFSTKKQQQRKPKKSTCHINKLSPELFIRIWSFVDDDCFTQASRNIGAVSRLWRDHYRAYCKFLIKEARDNKRRLSSLTLESRRMRNEFAALRRNISSANTQLAQANQKLAQEEKRRLEYEQTMRQQLDEAMTLAKQKSDELERVRAEVELHEKELTALIKYMKRLFEKSNDCSIEVLNRKLAASGTAGQSMADYFRDLVQQCNDQLDIIANQVKHLHENNPTLSLALPPTNDTNTNGNNIAAAATNSTTCTISAASDDLIMTTTTTTTTTTANTSSQQQPSITPPAPPLPAPLADAVQFIIDLMVDEMSLKIKVNSFSEVLLQRTLEKLDGQSSVASSSSSSSSYGRIKKLFQ